MLILGQHLSQTSWTALLITLYLEQRVWLYFLGVWLQIAFKPHSFFPLCPTFGQADKKARVFLLWRRQEIQTMQAHILRRDLPLWPHPLTTIKTRASLLPLFFQAFQICLTGCSARLRDLNYLSSKTFPTLLVCVGSEVSTSELNFGWKVHLPLKVTVTVL